VLITPHTAGETCRYEDNVLAIVQENLARLWRGETELLTSASSAIPTQRAPSCLVRSRPALRYARFERG
jgi:phosphoglycerate dehydrogenase-like enzyme